MISTSNRWFRTNEIFEMLKNYHGPAFEQIPFQPAAGQYFFVRPVMQRGWKRDGHTYVPRHNGIGTREDVEKLKLQGKPVIVCLYSQTTSGLHRRIYREQEGSLALVHYLSATAEPPRLEPPSEEFIDRCLLSEFSVEENFCDLQIESREEKNTSRTTCTDESFKEEIKIVDFSPEWDYTEGGAKLMLCYQPLRELQGVRLSFGGILQEAVCLQPGVLKCTVPPNPAGRYKLQLFSIDGQSEGSGDFEYLERKKRKKRDRQSQQQLLTKEDYESSEVKVRVIEKITHFEQFLNSKMCNQQFEHDEIKQIDDLNDQVLNNLIERCIAVAHQANVDINEYFDLLDEHNFAMLHYLVLLGYSQCIKTIIKNGANINSQAIDGLTGLQIAIILQKEEVVNLLIQLGAIDQSFNDNIFKIDQIYENKQILDLIVRGYTLCDSLHNSSSYTEQQSWNEQDCQEEISLFEFNDIFDPKTHQPKQEEKQTKHKYLRHHPKQKESREKKEPSFRSGSQSYETYQDHIKVIQKNVRAWLLRRQYLDVKYATQVLQNYIRNRLNRKGMNPECKDKIKSTVRNWLNIKE